eukprot:6175893-Pleurochrysis_carterae.AAC.2
MSDLEKMVIDARLAARESAGMEASARERALIAVRESLCANRDKICAANAEDKAAAIKVRSISGSL